jgi:hypothetical protein
VPEACKEIDRKGYHKVIQAEGDQPMRERPLGMAFEVISTSATWKVMPIMKEK